MEFIQLSEKNLSAYHIRGFEKYSSVHVPGTVLESGDTKMNKWGLGEENYSSHNTLLFRLFPGGGFFPLFSSQD